MDDDIYAYEHEMDEMDEWEAMHAHEMEAAEEAMREMDAAYTTAAAPSKAVASSSAPAAPTHEHDSSSNDSHNDATDAASAIDAKIARAQERLNQVLSRCATLMGEDDDSAASQAHDSTAAVGVDDPSARPGAPLQPLQTQQQQNKTKPSAALDAATASYLHSRPPMDVDSLSVVLGNDGRRMFLRKKAPSSSSAAATTAASTASALSLMPIEAMLASIERVRVSAIAYKCNVCS